MVNGQLLLRFDAGNADDIYLKPSGVMRFFDAKGFGIAIKGREIIFTEEKGHA